MSDASELVRRPSLLSTPQRSLADFAAAPESGEAECPAFGYLRGLHERALMIEFRLRSGNSEAFPYSWLGPVQFNPSEGLAVRFVGDQVYLVLIRGSNLAAFVEGTVNLTDCGIQRHRIRWVREMEPEATGSVVVDRIEIQAFESQVELEEYLRQTAPGFLRQRDWR